MIFDSLFQCFKKIRTLKESEQKFRVLFDNIPVMAYVIDKDHKYIAYNKASAEFFRENIGKTTQELKGLSPEIREVWYRAEDQVIKSGRPAWYIEKSKSRYDQESVYYENWLSPVKDKEGNVEIMIGVSHNITNLKKRYDIANQRKQMLEELVKSRTEELESMNNKLKRTLSEYEIVQKALEESENKYRMLVETLNDSLIFNNEDGIITFVNQRTCEMLGYEKNELIGRELTSLIHEESLKVFQHNIQQKSIKGLNKKYRGKFLKKNGEFVNVIVSPKPILDEKGRYKGTLGVIMDITELKETENRLFELYKHLGTINLQISVLLDVHKFSNKIADREKINDYTLVSALSLSNADVAALYKFDQENFSFNIISSTDRNGKDDFDLKTIPGKLSEIQKLIERRKIIQGSVIDEEDAVGMLKSKFSYFLALPLVKGDNVGGMLILGYYGHREGSIHELDLYEAFAAQISFVLFNAGTIS